MCGIVYSQLLFLVALTDRLVCWDKQIFNTILFNERRQLHTSFYTAVCTYIVQKGFVKQIGQNIEAAPVWWILGIFLFSLDFKCQGNVENQ